MAMTMAQELFSAPAGGGHHALRAGWPRPGALIGMQLALDYPRAVSAVGAGKRLANAFPHPAAASRSGTPAACRRRPGVGRGSAAVSLSGGVDGGPPAAS